MNTDPLWHPFVWLIGIILIVGFIVIGVLTNYDSTRDTESNVGCAFFIGMAVAFFLAAIYIFWYLHVKIV